MSGRSGYRIFSIRAVSSHLFLSRMGVGFFFDLLINLLDLLEDVFFLFFYPY
jgi:hypothetical protein